MQKNENKNKTYKKKQNPVLIIIIIVCTGTFIFAAWNLFKIWSGYHEAKTEYESVAEYATAVGSETQEYPEINMNLLLEKNPDTIGWIYFNDPSPINYPIVYSGDNWTYLSSTFEGVFNGAGTLFVDMNNSKEFEDCNTIIYGHNMYDNSMFGSLREFADPEYGKTYGTFYLYLLNGGVYKCHSFAFYKTTSESDTYTIRFESREEYQDYQQRMKSNSEYDFGIEPSPDQHMVTLSTCTNVEHSERYVLQAVIEEKNQENDPCLPDLPWTNNHYTELMETVFGE